MPLKRETSMVLPELVKYLRSYSDLSYDTILDMVNESRRDGYFAQCKAVPTGNDIWWVSCVFPDRYRVHKANKYLSELLTLKSDCKRPSPAPCCRRVGFWCDR